jgi:hypothetical protein
MDQFSHELNIKCYRNLLETSLDETERRRIQEIIVEEEEKEASRASGCRRVLCWNWMWPNLQRHEVIGSGSEVNCLIDGRYERLPAIDLAHVDLTGGEQCPEQHGGGLC